LQKSWRLENTQERSCMVVEGLKKLKKKSVKSGKLIKNEKKQKVDGKCVGELKGMMQK